MAYNVKQRKKLLNILNPVQTIALGFVMMILIGAVLLALPVSSQSGQFTPFVDTLFTATSATCVTGLVVYDTATYWSVFGQAVILVLIQIGGLGFMTAATMVSFLIHRRITLRERLVMIESLNEDSIQGIVKMTKMVIFITFAFELTGALILSFKFVPEMGARGIWISLFTAVSAYCNAGFDLMGTPGAQFVNMMPYQDSFLVNITLMLLVVFGGLGFFALMDICKNRKFKRFRLHTKLVLITTTVLILGGATVFFLLEYTNPATIGEMPLHQKIMASFFQSVTTRTAGFNTIDQASMTPLSKIMSLLFMFIGGSPGSTAGGVKTVTFVVLILTVRSVIQGRKEVDVFKNRISHVLVLRSLAIIAFAITLIFTAFTAIYLIEGGSALHIMFETVSGFATVGLSCNLTPQLQTVSKLILMMLMYVGRIGIITFVMALVSNLKDSNISYPEGRISVG